MTTEDIIQNKLNFAECFIGTLLAPVQTFSSMADRCKYDLAYLPESFFMLILVFSLDGLRVTPAKQINLALFNIPCELMGGISTWLLSVTLISLLILCFSADSKITQIRSALITLAWSYLPWIFLSPISCFWKQLGQVQVLFSVLPLIWIFYLQIIAIKVSLGLRSWQVLILMFLIPSVFSLFQAMQFIQTIAATFTSFIGP